MTTAVESLEALHLWLATELPELRLTLLEAYRPPSDYSDSDIERGWVPNVATDTLLEALRERGWKEIGFGFGFRPHATEPDLVPAVRCSLDKGLTEVPTHASGPTPFEALCRAARKALE